MRPWQFCWKNVCLSKSAWAIEGNQTLMAADYSHELDCNCYTSLPLHKNNNEEGSQVPRVHQLVPLVSRELAALIFEDHPPCPAPTGRDTGSQMASTAAFIDQLATKRMLCWALSPQGPSGTIRALLRGIECAMGKVWLAISICASGAKQ